MYSTIVNLSSSLECARPVLTAVEKLIALRMLPFSMYVYCLPVRDYLCFERKGIFCF